MSLVWKSFEVYWLCKVYPQVGAFRVKKYTGEIISFLYDIGDAH